MPKNKLSDLNDHLFLQLERLNDENLTESQIKIETERAMAVNSTAQQIISNAKIRLDAMKLVDRGVVSFNDFPDSFSIKKIGNE